MLKKKNRKIDENRGFAEECQTAGRKLGKCAN